MDMCMRVDNAMERVVEAVKTVMGDQDKVTIHRDDKSLFYLIGYLLRARVRLNLAMDNKIRVMCEENGDIVLEKMI